MPAYAAELTAMGDLNFKDRVLGGLWGAVVGDAVGVPVEFRSRAEVQRNPVPGLRGHGTYNQPKGTWSDVRLYCSVRWTAFCGTDLTRPTQDLEMLFEQFAGAYA